MASLRELYLRLRWLARQSRFHSELADEMQFHIESRAEELETSGVLRAEALAQARREFGPLSAAARIRGAPVRAPRPVIRRLSPVPRRGSRCGTAFHRRAQSENAIGGPASATEGKVLAEMPWRRFLTLSS